MQFENQIIENAWIFFLHTQVMCQPICWQNKVFAWNEVFLHSKLQNIELFGDSKEMSKNNKNEWNVLATSNILHGIQHVMIECVRIICSDDMHLVLHD